MYLKNYLSRIKPRKEVSFRFGVYERVEGDQFLSRELDTRRLLYVEET